MSRSAANSIRPENENRPRLRDSRLAGGGAEIGATAMVTVLEPARNRLAEQRRREELRGEPWINRFPKWLRSVVARAQRAGRVKYPYCGAGSSRYTALDCMRLVAPIVFDHVGCEGGCLVTEPYRSESDPQLIQEVQRLADVFHLEYRISDAESRWNPEGGTTRISLWPRSQLHNERPQLCR